MDVQRHWLLILITCLYFPLVQANETEQKNKELTALKSSINKTKQWLTQAKDQQNQQENALETLDKKMASNRLLTGKLNQQLTELAQQQQQLQQSLDLQLQQQIAQKNSMQQLLIQLYKQGQQSWLKQLLSSDSPNSASTQLKYFEFLTDYQSQQLHHYLLGQQAVKEQQHRIQQQQQLVNDKKSHLNKNKQQLIEDKNKRAVVLTNLANKIKSKDQQLQNDLNNAKQLTSLIKTLRQNIDNVQLGKFNKPFSSLKGQLLWPIKKSPSNRFGSKKSNGLTWDGWVMPANNGSPVKAIAQGRVVIADWLRGYGLLIIIDHGQGFLSLYGYNENVLVKEGQWVNAGTAIAHVGSSGNYTKAALYFAIKKNTETLNPRHWLSNPMR